MHAYTAGAGNSQAVDVQRRAHLMQEEDRNRQFSSHRCDLTSHTCTKEGNSRRRYASPVDIQRGDHSMQAMQKEIVSSRQRVRPARAGTRAYRRGNSRTVDARGDQEWSEKRRKNVRNTRCNLRAYTCTGGGNSRTGVHFMQKAKRNRQTDWGWCKLLTRAREVSNNISPHTCTRLGNSHILHTLGSHSHCAVYMAKEHVLAGMQSQKQQ